MNEGKVSRMIVGLRQKGWSDKEINDFILYVENAIVQPTINSVTKEKS